MIFQWSSRALVSVSCVFCGCLLCWIVVSRPGANRRFDVVLYVFYECLANASVIASASASAIANAGANANANANSSANFWSSDR